MTWSIIARDQKTGEIGIAVATRFFAVGSQVPHVEAGAGAVARCWSPTISRCAWPMSFKASRQETWLPFLARCGRGSSFGGATGAAWLPAEKARMRPEVSGASLTVARKRGAEVMRCTCVGGAPRWWLLRGTGVLRGRRPTAWSPGALKVQFGISSTRQRAAQMCLQQPRPSV